MGDDIPVYTVSAAVSDFSRTCHSSVARSVLFLPQREKKRGRADTANGNVKMCIRDRDKEGDP